jgi:hypothetical protein
MSGLTPKRTKDECSQLQISSPRETINSEGQIPIGIRALFHKHDPDAAYYLDLKRFPLTTQGDLDLHDQRLLDAFKMDSLREYRENGGTLNPKQVAIDKELEEKANWIFHDEPTEPPATH